VVSNLGLIRRLSDNIVLAFDGDKAGFNASNRAGKIALALGMDVKVAQMAEDVDPADLILKSGVDAWKEAIRKSKHIIEFVLDKIVKNANGDVRKMGRDIKEEVLPYVDALGSSIEKVHFLKRISDISGIKESALEEDLKKIEQESKFEKKDIEITSEVKNQILRKDYILRKLLGIVLWQQTLKEASVDGDKVLEELVKILNTKKEEILSSVSDNKQDLIFEAEVFYGGGSDLKKDIEELLFNLKEEYLKEELMKKMRELYFAEEKKDQVGSTQILKEISEINKKIQEIKNSRIKK
jgi:DNA primase